jgi:hypothetical protein
VTLSAVLAAIDMQHEGGRVGEPRPTVGDGRAYAKVCTKYVEEKYSVIIDLGHGAHLSYHAYLNHYHGMQQVLHCTQQSLLQSTSHYLMEDSACCTLSASEGNRRQRSTIH